MKSTKKLYKKRIQPPKYAIGAILAPLAAAATTSAVPATGAAATGALSAGTSAAIAGATGAAATTAGTTAATTANAVNSASTGVPFGMLKSNANPSTMQGFNNMLGIDPTKAASVTPKTAGVTPNLGSSKDAGWLGNNIEDLANWNIGNATSTTNTGSIKKDQMTQSRGARDKVNDIMQLDSVSDIMSLNKLPMLAISGIREFALERQKSRMNQMNFANNMNANMNSGAYGDSGMMRKGGIMKSVAELTGQEYIVPKELIPYALAAGNAKPYASDKTDGAYSHETNPIQVYKVGENMYMDEQGNSMQAGDLIIPEHKANSRAGIMSAINQNPYNNKATSGIVVDPTSMNNTGSVGPLNAPDKKPFDIYSPLRPAGPLQLRENMPFDIYSPLNLNHRSGDIKPVNPLRVRAFPGASYIHKTPKIEVSDLVNFYKIEVSDLVNFYNARTGGGGGSSGSGGGGAVQIGSSSGQGVVGGGVGVSTGTSGSGSGTQKKNQSLDQENRGLDKYDRQLLEMGAYTMGTNLLNRLTPAEQVKNVELINPREANFNPYFMQRQAMDMANQYYNTSQYTKSGSLSDNMANAINAQQASNEVITKTGAAISEAQQAEDFKNAEIYNTALAQNADAINKTNMYNAELLQKANALKSEINYRNMQELNKSIIGAQELRNLDKSQQIQEDVIRYQLELQKIQAENDTNYKKWQQDYQMWLDSKDKDPSKKPQIPPTISYPIFNFRTFNNHQSKVPSIVFRDKFPDLFPKKINTDK